MRKVLWFLAAMGWAIFATAQQIEIVQGDAQASPATAKTSNENALPAIVSGPNKGMDFDKIIRDGREKTKRDNKHYFDMADRYALTCKHGSIHGFFIGAGSPRPWIMGAPDISQQMKLLDDVAAASPEQKSKILDRVKLLCNYSRMDDERACMGVAYSNNLQATPWAMSWAVYKEYGEKAKNYTAFIARVGLDNGLKANYLLMAKKSAFICEDQVTAR